MPQENGQNISNNLYAFLPGLFYCSSQQTSVDAVLIEVTQRAISGLTLPSFRPEDVRTFDVEGGIALDKNGEVKPFELTLDTLGSFGTETFLSDSGISHEIFSYKRELQIASRLAEKIPLRELKRAYVSSSFLQSRLKKLLDDIEFYELKSRDRIYIRNREHPYGTVVEVNYNDSTGSNSRLEFPDDIGLGDEIGNLLFSKLVDEGEETNIQNAINDMRSFIENELQGEVSGQYVLKKLFEEVAE